MRIAVDLRIIRLYGHESRGYYVYDLLKRIVTGNPSQEFIFLFDGPYSKKLVFSENIIPVIVRPEANSPLGWKYWYDYKIPKVMRNIQADCFVAASGICSMRIGIPQILILQDLVFLNRPDDYRKSWLRYFKSQTIRHCRKAKRIITATYAVAKEIQNLDQGNTGKISLVKGFADECFQPLPWYEREYIKDKYAGGKDFFLFLGPVRPGTSPLQLIKAFSRFKKWQQSNMKMLIAGKWDEGCEEILLQLESYRFREDLVLLEEVSRDVLTKIIASAYLLVDPSSYNRSGQNLLEAMRCETPVICAGIEGSRETAGDAAAYFQDGNEEELAELLKRMYKDEAWREDLIEKGRQRAGLFSLEDSAAQLWKEILDTTKE